MSNQQYRHAGRKLSPAELVELLTDQHSAWVDDPIMLWLSMSLEDMADVVTRAIKCGESDPFYADGIPRFIATKALTAACEFAAGLDKGGCMSEKVNDGGAAFPCEMEIEVAYDGHNRGKGIARHQGMSLRDYFAAKAIPAIIAQCVNDTMHGMSKADYFAGRAYEIADAMLKARQS